MNVITRQLCEHAEAAFCHGRLASLVYASQTKHESYAFYTHVACKSSDLPGGLDSGHNYGR